MDFMEAMKMFGRIKDIKKNVEEYRKELPDKRFTATSGSGLVTVTVNGLHMIVSVALPDDRNPRSLESDIAEATNMAIGMAVTDQAEKLKELSGGVDLSDFI
ncbi:MAG: YbaB/EbfC family nucleoid-associated protein [Victivallaceae bacterium]|nr:YbaB/EbfC family nucleoid-associated protein [Victivallaceae bacterium]